MGVLEELEIQASAALPEENRWARIRKRAKRFLAYCGPGYMIAVGYMDPGNWATGIEAGSRYGYALLWVILLSNLMAMVLQHLCVRLGATTKMDLAEACRRRCPRWLNWILYVFAEVAMISTDLAEVIGTAIALRLLFGLPILFGVFLTVFDVLLLLSGLSSDESKSAQILEIIVIALMTVIGACFTIELFIVKPSWSQAFYGFIPHNLSLFTEKDALFAAIGIIGATVMPHNLYLHSFLVKQRLADLSRQAQAPKSTTTQASEGPQPIDSMQSIVGFATIDTVIALFLALFVNAAILITSAAAFYAHGYKNVRHIEEASELMRKWMGPASSIIFGLALLAAGQSSTVTGTLAGQVVFEGFLQIKMKPWLRRIVTRAVAIAPALLIILILGEDSINWLLLMSQVILTFQLPFAIIPLIIFTFTPPESHLIEDPSNLIVDYWVGRQVHWKEHALRLLCWAIAIFILFMNALLIFSLVK